MAEQDQQDRNLPASPRKIKKAREEGQVARSRHLGHFIIVGAGVAALAVGSPWLAAWLQDLLAHELTFRAADLRSPQQMTERLAALVLKFLLVTVPLGAVIGTGVVVSNIASGGWNWTLKPLQPKFSKLNPVTGLGRLVSKEQLLEAAKASGFALVIGTVGGVYLYAQLDAFVAALGMALPAGIGQVGQTLLNGLALMLLVLAVSATVDVPLQRHLLAKRLKMSHQEAKQEHKELEGNQEVKVKMKARMREMVKRRMMAAVPRADLVVMNPTHYAVALKYDEATMAAPRVVAKGADLLALQIRDIAREHEVPVLQAPVLARALYAHAELDREIPLPLYGAVAQVLAYVYQLRAAMIGQAPMPGELPPLDVPAELDPHHGKAAEPA
ncbi:flagellar biosynthesis protein FlhB [Caldimonas thermodepolymerans]|jgi:flagellar biosynthetic protein FlhB|uniref:Flagellar biosynthetic protein FlhB n=1 Tax=Caldimonas thermodepolymerans TaxID=215580 RepID=A0A2S5T0T5_9BURK|nr:flagellar type III secretion system protein FlhB [Caldimonas thermodepolymerans]PPE68457.1 flagellar biosynthetic protein FlhB [Caldimonas thermodepolymerans]QPC30773.1 flagellar biosynthesis protein FlhB [Caldimonas thermodepolymerans]RDI02607.1 flagellar biosynthetic protein FlhB [Caldimonas thermodepolymerans]TCP08865.1 flagellar biosynthetic protein FlhB [Caldimonas thermodepolymerans]UZG47184.1 flagellar type III secretion system protein FlhB [Caldimonas thermodepolymerans]